MNSKFLCVLFAFVALLSCNTAKHLEKQQQAIESLTNKVNASKIVQVKDSIIYKEGKTETRTDTAVIWNNVGDTIIKELHYSNYYYRNDTLKIYQADPLLVAHERALFSENEKNKALIGPLSSAISDLKKETARLQLRFYILLIVAGVGLGYILKLKIL